MFEPASLFVRRNEFIACLLFQHDLQGSLHFPFDLFRIDDWDDIFQTALVVALDKAP